MHREGIQATMGNLICIRRGYRGVGLPTVTVRWWVNKKKKSVEDRAGLGRCNKRGAGAVWGGLVEWDFLAR